MTSESSGCCGNARWRLGEVSGREPLLAPPAGCVGYPGDSQSYLVAMHEGALLEEGRVYLMGGGWACIRHNPRSVQPHPRGTGRSRKGMYSSQPRASIIRPELKMPYGARGRGGGV